ncbi:MAG: acylphosphatase [Deltaproteobacteria bacterium]|nr:acylphosphatase [Deltaproteobacteria bacterium]
MTARRLLVSGLVQGVGYRAWVERTALSLGLVGWVRNLADGRVEIHAEGDGVAVETLYSLCQQGPRLARVSSVDVETRKLEGHTEFMVRSSALGPS